MPASSDYFTHLRVLLVLQELRHCGPVQISSWPVRLMRSNLSFWTNRGNYHGFNSTIWLYMLSYEPLTFKSVSNECDPIADH
jgi:hypothetical protein